ncbi:MAG: hypothetical protein KDK90_25510 [Leptospiraceae bacterium]|nr:hypothetical protein [Leptospiraceae bacterium]
MPTNDEIKIINNLLQKYGKIKQELIKKSDSTEVEKPLEIFIEIEYGFFSYSEIFEYYGIYPNDKNLEIIDKIIEFEYEIFKYYDLPRTKKNVKILQSIISKNISDDIIKNVLSNLEKEYEFYKVDNRTPIEILKEGIAQDLYWCDVLAEMRVKINEFNRSLFEDPFNDVLINNDEEFVELYNKMVIGKDKDQEVEQTFENSSNSQKPHIRYLELYPSYISLIEGVPDKKYNQELVEKAIEKAREDEEIPVHLIKPKITYNENSIPLLPNYTIIVRLETFENYFDRELNVVLFVNDISSKPITKIVEEYTKDLDWNNLSKPCDW